MGGFMIRRRLLGISRAKLITGIISMAVLTAVVLFSLFANRITTYNPIEQNPEIRLSPPGVLRLAGTDGFGRDVFSRLIYGGRNTLAIGFGSVAGAAIIGIFVGLISAYKGGWVDLLIGRSTDVILGFPYLVLSIVIIVSLTPSALSTSIAIGLALAPRVIRLTRAGVLSVKQQTYVKAARTVGASNTHIIFAHILPNSIGPVLVQVAGYFGTAIGAETVLSYLGLGVPPPYPSWGRMLQEGTRLYFEAAPWLTLLPGLALSITVVCLALVTDLLRNIFDPIG
jgi:peptide/nickel transport system permease protein